jgi:nitroreductase
VAARALGLGATFTTFHLAAEKEFRGTLGIPADVYLGVSVAVGYPARKHGPVNRKPVQEVMHWDRW